MRIIKMEFTKTVQISGDKDKYTISPEIKKYALKSLTELGDEGFIMVRQNKKKELCFVYHPLKSSLPNLGNVIIECNEI